HIYAQQHIGVLNSAELCALSHVEAGVQWVNPHLIRVIGNEVYFPRELRNPKTVIGICRKELQIGRSGLTRITHGNVKLVCHDEALFWIAVLPPELMPDDGNLERRLGLRGILYGEDY